VRGKHYIPPSLPLCGIPPLIILKKEERDPTLSPRGEGD